MGEVAEGRGVSGDGRRPDLGGEHSAVTGDALGNCTPESYIMVLTNVTPINSVKNHLKCTELYSSREGQLRFPEMNVQEERTGDLPSPGSCGQGNGGRPGPRTWFSEQTSTDCPAGESSQWFALETGPAAPCSWVRNSKATPLGGSVTTASCWAWCWPSRHRQRAGWE